MEKMCSRFICMVLILVESWEFAATSEGHHHQGEGQTLQSSRPFKGEMEPEKECKGGWIKINGPGSKPPECEHKCRGCQPCIAVQNPERTGHLGVEYANYKPEGWVCKCASSFFIP